MEQEKTVFKCSGNCLSCMPAQRAYCASQHSYSNMRVLDRMMGIVIEMQGEIKTIAEKIEAMQNNEAMLFDPMRDAHDDELIDDSIAQEGSGAEE